MADFIPSNQTRGYRQVASQPINADSQQFLVDLPRGPHLEAAWLRVVGSLNISVAFAAGVRDVASFYMFRRVDWVLNSNVTLDSVSGPQALMTCFTRRQLPAGTNPTAGIAASVPFSAFFPLDRCLMDMMRAKDSLLKTDVGVSNNQLRIQMGAAADMFLPGAGAATFNAGTTMSVWVNDYQEARDQQGNTPSPLWYPKRNGFVAQLANGNGQQIKLNTGNRLRAISMRALDPTTREPLAVLTRARVQRAGDTRVDMSTNDLLTVNSIQFGSNVMNNQRIIDLANPGSLGVKYSEFWPIPSSADTFLVVDTTAACLLEVVTLEGVDLVQPS